MDTPMGTAGEVHRWQINGSGFRAWYICRGGNGRVDPTLPGRLLLSLCAKPCPLCLSFLRVLSARGSGERLACVVAASVAAGSAAHASHLLVSKRD